jgi:hypothetical protein
VKNESDAALAYSVSSALVTSLIAYKVKHIKNLESAAQVLRHSFFVEKASQAPKSTIHPIPLPHIKVLMFSEPPNTGHSNTRKIAADKQMAVTIHFPDDLSERLYAIPLTVQK